MTFTVHKDVKVVMRDGTELATDLWVPETTPAPTLLVRLPYGKDLPALFAYGLVPNIFALTEAGYAVVWQDCRGTFRSGGEFTPMLNEPADGADTVAWLLEQPWCDGNIGTYGPSYLGFVQWASLTGGARLKAIAPCVTTTDYYTTPWYSDGGAMSWHTIQSWSTTMALVEAIRRGDGELIFGLGAMVAEPEPHLAALPPSHQPLLEKMWPWWSELQDHPARDQYWQDLSVIDHAEQVTVPALHIGGWFDIFAANTARSFTELRARAGTEEARHGQRLIIGPWDHLNSTGIYPDRRFGMLADAITQDITGEHVKFFDRWLRGNAAAEAAPSPAGAAPVKIFVMGIDQWRDEQDWPLPDTSYEAWYLDGSGQANSSAGDGLLRPQPPAAEATDTYLYDPLRPVPTLGGRIMLPTTANQAGAVDQRQAEARDDVLCFSSDVLTEPLEVTGHVSLTLFASSSAPDTDFTGKLVDVFPDGRAIYLTDGILRARYRDSLAEPEPLTPGQPYELSLDLSVTSNVFLPGHRIRLEVSSSNFPRYDRNSNTGGVITSESADQVTVAVNRILHGPGHPSRLILPVIRR